MSDFLKSPSCSLLTLSPPKGDGINYSDETLALVKQHLEMFCQLIVFRYGAEKQTLYMKQLVKYLMYFMRALKYPLNRVCVKEVRL